MDRRVVMLLSSNDMICFTSIIHTFDVWYSDSDSSPHTHTDTHVFMVIVWYDNMMLVCIFSPDVVPVMVLAFLYSLLIQMLMWKMPCLGMIFPTHSITLLLSIVQKLDYSYELLPREMHTYVILWPGCFPSRFSTTNCCTLCISEHLLLLLCWTLWIVIAWLVWGSVKGKLILIE